MASLHVSTASSLLTGNLQAKQHHHRHCHLPLSPRLIQCALDDQAPARRNANFQPSLFPGRYLKSFVDSNEVKEEERANRINILKEKTKQVISEEKNLGNQLQLIDHLKQLGIAYHFKDEIKSSLRIIYNSLEDISKQLQNNLHATALLFRLLRENGFDISEDIFKILNDETDIMSLFSQQETKGILALYEASYLAKEGEVLLNKAMIFTTRHLKSLLLNEGSVEPPLKEHLAHALELPLNWRMQRLHNRWFIEACKKQKVVNHDLLELAILDFNEVQSIHKRELSELSRWWENLGLAYKLPIFRDRLTENYLWAIGFAYEPQFWIQREMQTKAICLAVMLDDVYDVYGALDELELFTDIVKKWDVNVIDTLPGYMKLCFLSIFNISNDAAYQVIRDKGFDTLPYLKRTWTDLCKAFLLEAKWYHQGHTPKLEEYLDSAWITSLAPMIITYAFCMNSELTEEALKSFTSYPKVAKCSSMLLRLHNDLATSTVELQRGDTSTSVHCIMHEKDVSEVVAQENVKGLIMANWRAINGDRVCSSSVEECFKNNAINLGRTAQFFYQHGDGYGKGDKEIRAHLASLLFQPIEL